MDAIRWGILGTGGIARKFADGLALLPDARLAAVGSRTRGSAEAFGKQWRIPHRHGSYAALMADPDVEVIYIATPHTLHRENALGCLSAGKAVLCEKPFTINARQAEEVIAQARSRKLFLMEAMWTRFFPVVAKVRSLLAEGAIGEVRQVQADFGAQPKFDPKSRLFDPALGGGALLDLGVYPVSLASMVFGEAPRRITSAARLGSTGVDEHAAAILEYSGGRMAVVSCAMTFVSPQEAHILGTNGRIRIRRPWWFPAAVTLSRTGKDDEEITMPYLGNGYAHEAAEVMECLRGGKMESTVMPLDETLRIMHALDSIRAPWGLKYPGD
ncbi:MAG: Gfo/Idh/MocA family oxidoreductase [Anaerolineales bacterium]|nr:Gfo/Idh/MocA family oxidoreductase [Anaerolineales bacterium]